MKMVVEHIPKDTSKEEVWGLFEKYGEITAITLTTVGNPDNVSAVVEMSVSRMAATVIADQLNDKYWKGRKLRVFPTLFFTDEKK